MSEVLSVKLETFEGPLDLLLELIKKNEMDITNIPMAEITQQYLEHLKQMQELKLEIAGEFLVMAATLVLIKSKTLLPLDEELTEEESGEDPRAELIQKLMEYQAFKEAARELSYKAEERSKVYTRNIADYYFKDLNSEDEEIDAFSANLYDLMQAFTKVVQSVDAKNFHEVFEEIISIDQRIDEIKRLLSGRRAVSFEELFHQRSNRNELIVTFLSILELAKQKFLTIKQPGPFEGIMLERAAENAWQSQPQEIQV